MKRVIFIVLIFVVCAVVAADEYRPPVEVASQSMKNGTLTVIFRINDQANSGTFTWEAAYELDGFSRTSKGTGSWSKGTVTVKASKYLSMDATVTSVRVGKVTVR